MNIKILLVCLFFSRFALADEPDCKNITVSAQVDECVKYAKESADLKLNLAYKKLIARVKSQYDVDPALGDKFLAKLKASQLAWIKLRDTNCPLEAFEIEEGKPAYITVVNNCIARMSLERSDYLDGTMKD